MSLQLAAKIGAAGTAVAAVPTSIYIIHNQFSLYAIEEEVINSSSNLNSSDVTGEETVDGEPNIVKLSDSDNKWSCLIRAKLTSDSGQGTNISEEDKKKLKKYIEKRVPTSNSESTTPEITQDTKKENKKILVWECSRNRKETNPSIKSWWTVTVKKTDSNSNLEVSFFGKKETVNETVS